MAFAAGGRLAQALAVMWSSPYFWSPLLGGLLYVAVVWSDEHSLSNEPGQLWQLAAFCAGLCLVFLLMSWFFVALSYSTTLAQLLTADLPAWTYRKTIYSCYSLASCGALSSIHATVLHALNLRGRRNGS